MAGAQGIERSPGQLSLTEMQERRLARLVKRAQRRARRRGEPVLAALTVPVNTPLDPAAVLCAARAPGEPWFVFEQPARDGAAISALGAAFELEAGGEERFEQLAARWRSLVTHGSYEGPDGVVPGAGPVAVGGLAFSPSGGGTAPWEPFGAGSMHVPEVCITRRGQRTRLTLSAAVAGDSDPAEVTSRLAARAASLDVAARLPEPEAHLQGSHRAGSTMPPEHYVDAVDRAVQRIAAGEFQKIVLARAVDVTAPAPYRVESLLPALREGFAECHLLIAARGESAFVAASPELLVRREGMRATTLALAGSSRRSADPAVDAHLGEQLLRSTKDRAEHDFVVRQIEQTLNPASVWVTAASEPVLAKIANIQHLATPIRAQLVDPIGALTLAGMLHPTPAVGGSPANVALPVIPALEGLDRGWYAGPVGWIDSAEDGEFIVGLRSALIQGTTARCYAGVGVVAESDPQSELAETEVKLGALLPLLTL